jgi:hypothetical protein
MTSPGHPMRMPSHLATSLTLGRTVILISILPR